MSKMNLGVFSSRLQAEEAIGELERAGYDPKGISVMMKDNSEAQEVAHNTGANVAGKTAAGATTGGVLGGIAGLLVGIGAISIPGVGALLIAGPVAAALGLTGAAATTVSGALTGALAGGIVGALVSIGVPEETAQVYEDRIKEGGVLVAIPTREGEGNKVREIMEAHGADQIQSISVPA